MQDLLTEFHLRVGIFGFPTWEQVHDYLEDQIGSQKTVGAVTWLFLKDGSLIRLLRNEYLSGFQMTAYCYLLNQAQTKINFESPNSLHKFCNASDFQLVIQGNKVSSSPASLYSALRNTKAFKQAAHRVRHPRSLG